jgi:hypothetical protein
MSSTLSALEDSGISKQFTFGRHSFSAHAARSFLTTTRMTLMVDGEVRLRETRPVSTALWFAFLALAGWKPRWSKSVVIPLEGRPVAVEVSFVTSFSAQWFELFIDGKPISEVTPKATLKGLVFIGYRREDTGVFATLLANSLRERYASPIFLDTHVNRVGMNFPSEVETALNEAGAFIAVIGKDWLNAGERAVPRLFEPNDWVRLEIESALGPGDGPSTRVPLLPVLVDRNALSRDELPDSIKRLADIQALSVRVSHLQHDLELLHERLAELLL